MNKKTITATLLRMFIAIASIYLLFTPLQYLWNSNKSLPAIFYIIINIIQYCFIIFVGVLFSRIIDIELKSRLRLVILFSTLSGLSILLSFMGISEKVYGTLANSFDIYNRFSSLFVIVLIEQLFNNHLITSVMLCSAICFLKPLDKLRWR